MPRRRPRNVVQVPKRRLIEAEIQRIETQFGRAEPDRVVEAASDPANPLHSEFEWDDTVAGHKYRLEQARALIASIKTTVRTETRMVRAVAYVQDTRKEPNSQGYIHVSRVRSDEDLKKETLKQELDRSASVLSRAVNLAEALEMEVAEQLTELLDRLREIAEIVMEPSQPQRRSASR